MGTDIHCFVEEKMYRTGINETDRTGKWISIDKWTKNSWAILYPERDEGPIWEVERKDMVFTESEKTNGSVNYMECGRTFLEAVNRLVGRKNSSDIRLIITFDN